MSEYFNVTTNVGDAAIATAIANNSKLNITHIAFGDGNGSVPTPTKTRTSLVREVHRQAVTKYAMHPMIANYIVIETIIPSNIGGFWIREIGIIADNVLISHGSHAPFFKVADPDGVSEYRLKFTQNVRDGNVVEISLDESLIYASQAWVNENYIRRNELVDNLTTDDAKKPVSAKQAKNLQDNKLDKTANAVSATKLKNARKINNVDFDGSDDITVTDDALTYMPIPYPKSSPPTGYLAMMGQAISESTYPKLYALYGAVLPDMRAYSVRGLDYGRGIDVDRTVLSQQGDAIRNITGALSTGAYNSGASGVFVDKGTAVARPDGESRAAISIGFDASRVVPTASENRVKNIAFLYIVKAG